MTAADVVLAEPTPSTDTPSNPGSAPAGRNARGQFAPGNPGGPGRPPKVAHIERELVAFMASAVSVELWMQIAYTAAQQAAEGNHTARAWLSKTFLSGRLTETAAADAIGLPTAVEMGEVGRLKHPRWVDFLDRKRAEQAEREAEETDENGKSPAETAKAQPAETGVAPVNAATTPAAPAASSVAWASAQAAPVSPPPPRTVPAAERVNGFRVTKGPREPFNRRKRQNAAKTAPCST